MHCLRLGIEGQKKSFLTLLSVVLGGLVYEPKSVILAGLVDAGLVDAGHVDNLAHIERPETECINLNGNRLADLNAGGRICDSHPSKIELLPFLKSRNRGFEDLASLANRGSRMIVCESSRQSRHP